MILAQKSATAFARGTAGRGQKDRKNRHPYRKEGLVFFRGGKGKTPRGHAEEEKDFMLAP